MMSLVISVVVGAVLAIGGTVITTEVVTAVANGTPPTQTQSLYNYGSR